MYTVNLTFEVSSVWDKNASVKYQLTRQRIAKRTQPYQNKNKFNRVFIAQCRNMNAETSDPHFQLTFKEVVVPLKDGNEILMARCINCNFITRYHSFCKLNHWRSCPWRWSFKYTKQGESITAVCIKCHAKFISPFYLDKTLLNHKAECAAAHQPDNLNLEDDFVPNETPDGIEYVREDQVCARELSGQLKVASGQNMVISAPAYRIRYFPSSNGLERFGECQKCQKTFRKPSHLKLSIHRRICKLEEELLFTVATQSMQVQTQQIPGQSKIFQPMILQPFDTTISSSVDDENEELQEASSSATCSNRICFICNTTSSDKFVNLFETLSKHSLVPVYEFVWKFLDDQPSVRDDSIEAANSSSVCGMCLSKINAYDLANQTAAKYERELRQQLSQTEAYYASQRQAQQEPMNDIQRDESEQVDVVADPLEIVNNNDDEDEDVDVDYPEIIEIDATGQVQTQEEEEEEEGEEARCVIELSDNEDEQTIELTDSE